MKVLKAKNTGFCFGVKRAINMVLKEAGNSGQKVYTMGPIIHNPQMVNILKEKGITPVDDVLGINDGVVVFRTHGIKKDEEEGIKRKGLRSIDTTCPFVKRVRKHALYLKNNGYKVVIIGDKNHPEVKSVLSYLDNDGIVLQEPVAIEAKKIGVVSQTTLDKDTFVNIVRELARNAHELHIFNTICESTEVRQKEAVDLAGKVDMMLVVGGKNSANTSKLCKVVQAVQPRVYQIETADEINPEWFLGVQNVGITAGASTPDLIIDSVERRVKNL